MRRVASGRRPAATVMFLALTAGSALLASAGYPVSEDVTSLHRDALVCDLHADTQFIITYMGYDTWELGSGLDIRHS
ncbi:MAG TPA: hypothetical protein VM658_01315 [bacterium]|nr:hypothetical protein [bacterium]